MAGFTLGGDNNQYPPSEIPPEETLFVYRSNEEISAYSNKGFELWHQQHHQYQRFAEEQEMYSTGAGPSRRRTSDHEFSSRGGANMLTMRSQGGVSCQDCGNQAKKDCMHMRCRTCCKSRALPCQTHVRSTWVPASRRRERQQQQLQQQQKQLQQIVSLDQQHQQQEQQIILAENTKRPREILAGHSSGSFPAQVNTPAVFRCVRVSSIDDSEDQYAYRTAVSIGGHVFKGILYDQGPDMGGTDQSSSGCSGDGDGGAVAHHGLLTADTNTTTACVTATSTNPSSSSSLHYATPLNAFVAGTQFFPHHGS